MLLSLVTVVGMTGSLLMVLVNCSSPDRTALGAVNGISTAVGCMARVVGPSLVSAVGAVLRTVFRADAQPQLFAISMDGKVLGGRLWWMFMVLMSIVNFTSAMFVAPDPSAVALQQTPV